ncbi:MAG: hypothetical protein JNL08_07180 [Planctomycetes bacterium]|nr:hypothetical protein [Planctomycetota bacterium]
MKALTTLVGLGLAAALSAQSPLTTIFAANASLNNNGGAALFFNMTVNTPITINRIDVNSNSAVGQAGRVELYVTNGAITQFSGSETTPANWTLLGSGPVVAAGLNLPSIACLTQPATLATGPRGYAVVYRGLSAAYTVGTATNLNYSTAELSFTAGAAAGIGPWYPDGLTAPFLGGANNPRVFNGALHYVVGSSAPVCSYSDRYSTGCGGEWASWFDLIEDPAVASTTLAGRQLLFIPDNPGTPTTYTVVKGAGTILPSAGHPVLNGTFATTILASPGPDDDGQVAVPISAPFFFPGGSTSSLIVHTNGMVSTGSNLAFLDTLAGDDWAPLVPGLLQAPATAWYSWHDYDASTATGGGQIKAFDDVANSQLIVTWDAVESYPAGAGNPSTLQMVFNYATGTVTIAWGTMAAVGAGGNGDEHLIGYSPGGVALRPFEGDVTSALPDTLVPLAVERADLLLTSDARPIDPTTIQYTIDNVPPIGIGVLFFATSNPNPFPGTDLGLFGLGKPRCLLNYNIGAYVDGFGLGFFFVADGVVGPGLNTTAAALLGAELWVQAAHLLSDGVNLFPVSTSNAIHQFVSNV